MGEAGHVYRPLTLKETAKCPLERKRKRWEDSIIEDLIFYDYGSCLESIKDHIRLLLLLLFFRV
jgi:hypothetical protein